MKRNVTGPIGLLFSTLLFSLFANSIPQSSLATDNTKDPFAILRGKWRGTGTMKLKNSNKVRVNCNAQYTGSARQLILSIVCASSSGKIDLRAKLSSNSNRLRGVWEEKTYKALGTISGKITEEKITFRIAGNVWGKMSVLYSKTRQKVSIETRGVSLENVQIKMKRR